jgi:flagellar protein FliO/FliZ
MMDFLFGADMPLAVRFFFAFVIVLALIGGTAFLVRRFGGERLGASSSRGRQPRLAVIDAAAVDGRRRLILIRRDNVEHLLMIGGPSDVVVEANIVRAAAPARDAAGPRPPAAPADAQARPVPIGEGNMWPLQPEPAPAPRPPRQPAMDEPMQWNEPEPPAMPPLPQRRAEARPEPRSEMRPEPRSEVRPEPRMVDPLAGLAAELARVQSEPPGPKARPQRERDITRPRVPQPERIRPAGPPSADEQGASTPDQNLAEMAQRLEAALRRPKPAEPRPPEAVSRPATTTPAHEPRPEPAPAPAVAEAAPPHEDAPPAAAQQQPAPARAAAAKPQKSVYDSLEQEMASLLGRPNTKA